VSKVMGPLIENLQEFGYTEKNLAALPVSHYCRAISLFGS
jgi:hypothetical protein